MKPVFRTATLVGILIVITVFIIVLRETDIILPPHYNCSHDTL